MKRSREVTFIYYRRLVKKGKTSEGQESCQLCGSPRESSKDKAPLLDECQKALTTGEGMRMTEIGNVRQLINRLTKRSTKTNQA